VLKKKDKPVKVVTMRTCIIAVTILQLLSLYKCDGTDDCLQLAYCNLIKGDLSRSSKMTEKDTPVFYKEAERNVAQNRLAEGGDETVLKTCRENHLKCTNEANKLAIDIMGFPEKYTKLCDYRFYSKGVFKCDNIKNWPSLVKTKVTLGTDPCQNECLINEKEDIQLNNGKKMRDIKDPLGPIKDNKKGTLGRQASNLHRHVDHWITSKNEAALSGKWGDIDSCDDNSWVDQILKLVSGAFFSSIQMNCRRIGDPSSQFVWNWIYSSPIYTPVLGYVAAWEPQCRERAGAPSNSYIVGIALRTEQFKTYGKIPKEAYYLCANDGKWERFGNTDAVVEELTCPKGEAICALQTRSDAFETEEFINGVRIGCCRGSAEHPEHFIHKCKSHGASCEKVDECCNATTASCSGGKCGRCASETQICRKDDECCDQAAFHCSNKKCSKCLQLGHACINSVDCCNKNCYGKCCNSDGESCAKVEDCCNPGQALCSNGKCQRCKLDGDICENADDCCDPEAATCFAGKCQRGEEFETDEFLNDIVKDIRFVFLD